MAHSSATRCGGPAAFAPPLGVRVMGATRPAAAAAVGASPTTASSFTPGWGAGVASRSRCTRPATAATSGAAVRMTTAAPSSPSVASRSTPASSSTVDYIVVGGGAAGCVLAARLSEDPTKRVLLLEAGGRDTKRMLHIPLGFPYLLGSDVDWAYTTEPEEALGGRRLYLPRGKVLGGSHAISVMLYQRGDTADYARWDAAAGGNAGWSAADMLPYFKRSEANTRVLGGGDGELSPADAARIHGADGPLAVSDLRCVNEMSSAFLSAASAAGLARNADFNDWERSQEGVGLFQVTQRNGARATPATTYLAAARGRKNLTVLTGVTVERVTTTAASGSSPPRATGVEYIDADGQRHVVAAAVETVLAGGVFASPQLLMLSGIGPAEDLQSHGIPVVVDAPGVGANLQDHPATMVSYLSHEPMQDKRKSSVYYTEKTGKSLLTLLRYAFGGKGPLTSPMCEAGGFVTTPSAAADGRSSADLQLRFIPFASEPDPYASLGEFAAGGSYLTNSSSRPAGFTLQSVVARPVSRGRVSIKSASVTDRPVIEAGWMKSEEDLATLVDGMKLCRKIAAQEPFSPYRGTERFPGGDVVSDADLADYARSTCHTANALVGTCALGDVVDAQLRVKGVAGLRVVDSSVMPTIVGGQTGAATMALAEKGADMIRAAAVAEAGAAAAAASATL